MVAIVPLKGLDDAKSRLGSVLAAQERRRIALRMLSEVVGACRGAGLAVCVVSPDPAARLAAEALGAETLDDGGADLSGAVDQALALHAGAEAVVVLAADLPYVTPDDVATLLDAARPLALVAGADGTTNAVAARPPTAFRPSYGPGSAARHGGERLDIPGLARDLDTPGDLAAWLEACPA